MNDIMKKLNELENNTSDDSKDKLLEKSAQTIEYLEMKVKSLEAELKHLRSNIIPVGNRSALSKLDVPFITDELRKGLKERMLQDMLKEIGLFLYKEGYVTVREFSDTVFNESIMEIKLQVYRSEEEVL